MAVTHWEQLPFPVIVCCLCPSSSLPAVTKRLGGSFGGKATRSMAVAAAAALAASHFGAPVCYNPSRRDDMAQFQGRCAGRVSYDVGFQEDGKVLAIKAQVRCGTAY